jgi:hypothetical protein
VRTFLRSIPTLMAIVVGSTSFLLSYVALRDVAASTGAVSSSLAWAVPVCIDGGILAASAAIWLAAATERKRDLLAFLTVVVLLGTSVMINIQHAGPSVTAKWIAALPPIVLLACLELVASGHRHRLKDAEEVEAVEEVTATDLTRPADLLQDVTAPPVAQVVAREPEAAAAVVATPAPPTPAPVMEKPSPAPAAPATQAVASVIEPAAAVAAAPVEQPVSDTQAKDDDVRPARKQLRVQAEAPEVPAAERIRAAFDSHVAAGNDPADPALADKLAKDMNVTDTYVRRVLRPLRTALMTQSA